jgi:hypothetical protein
MPNTKANSDDNLTKKLQPKTMPKNPILNNLEISAPLDYYHNMEQQIHGSISAKEGVEIKPLKNEEPTRNV